MRFIFLLGSIHLFSLYNTAVKINTVKWLGIELPVKKTSWISKLQLWLHHELGIKTIRVWGEIGRQTLRDTMFWLKMLHWERGDRRNRRKQIQPCQRWRFIFETCFTFMNIYPGNPVEEWLWFKHCRRKGISYSVQPSKYCLYREVSWVLDQPALLKDARVVLNKTSVFKPLWWI